jgi:putative aminopeptidase FrvX
MQRTARRGGLPCGEIAMRKRAVLFAIFQFLISVFLFVPAGRAQSLAQDLAALTARPAVTGYEQALAAEIEKQLEKFKPQRDNLGNLWVTLGSGGPTRLIVAPLDEPGYIVSGITDDGYLRVQRLPQAAPHGLFDQLFAAQPVVIHTRAGKWVYGVVAGLSTHLQGGRRDAPRTNHPDELFVDIGASSAAEVRRAGVELLDPIGLDRELRWMSGGRVTAPGVGDRFGAAALLELLRRVDAKKLTGTLIVAFVTQHWAGVRGLDRLTQHSKADEAIFVGRFRRAPSGGPGGAAAAAQRQQQPAARRAPGKEPGSGALIASQNPDAALEGLPADLKKLAEEQSIPLATDFSAPLPRASYTQGPALPPRVAHLGIAAAWPSTPAEFLSLGDLDQLVRLLEAYAQGTASPPAAWSEPVAELKPTPAKPKVAPGVTEILKSLVETYGMSGYETAVREEIARLLPAWAKPETDADGNLILRWKDPAAKKAPKILFVAHSDEIGYLVRAIAKDGRLEVQSRGGGTVYFFAGHAMLVQTANGVRAGVMELPAGWDAPDFQWPAGPQAGPLRVDVGARSAAEVEQLGIKVNDWITVPKKYRKLFGARANGRSFDDRVGCTALVSAVWALGPSLAGRDITFVWATREEVGLEGALAVARKRAAEGDAPDFVFAVDTFVSSDSPLESPRFADAPIGKGFVVRAVDNSNIARRDLVDRVIKIARANQIPVQWGVTGGGNDGATFLHTGSLDIPIGWALRYSHSPGEVIDTRDVEALARIVTMLSRHW